MRRLSLLLTGAALALSGAAPATAAPLPGPAQVCVYAVCVCVTVTKCAGIDPSPTIDCVRVDLNDDGVYEEVCV